MRTQKCGIVVLNYNSYDDTVKLVNQIVQFESVDYVCVVDNNSGDSFDGSFASCKVHYIKSKTNGGYSAGNNIGFRWLIEQKQCDIVYIANPDVEFKEETISKINEAFEQHPEIALLSSERYGAGNAKIHQYFEFPDFKTSYMHCFYLGRSKLEKKRRSEQYQDIDNSGGLLYVDAVPGAFFGIRSEFLVKNGYMYEGIFMYGEELILGKQASLLGYRAAVVGGVCYYHNHKGGRFSSLNGVILDNKSLKIYYKLFYPKEWLKRALLSVTVAIGNMEYRIAYYLYNFIKKKGN